MPRRFGLVGIVLLSLVLAVQVSGCTLIGFGVGLEADRKASVRQRYRAGDLARLESGSSLEVLLEDSSRVAGRYLGATLQEASAYRARYEAWRSGSGHEAKFPEWDERVELDPGGKGEFRGFVIEGVLIRTGRRGVVPVVSSGMLHRASGGALDLLDVRDLVLAGDLPIATLLRIETDEGERQVPADRIVQVDGTGPKNAAIRGLLVGMAFDGLVIYIATRDHPKASSSPQCEEWDPFTYRPSSR